MEQGATIPFIARYKKDRTGSLDEVQIEAIENLKSEIDVFQTRKEAILKRLAELNVRDASLLARIENCDEKNELEDLYLPYKQKRETRASRAKALGLLPLAKILMSQKESNINPIARHYARHNLTSEQVLQGARDIIAEWINESSHARSTVRYVYERNAELTSKVVKTKSEEAQKYRDYFDFTQSLKRIPSHRLLAILRAEKEGFLKFKLGVDKAYVLNRLEKIFVKSKGESGKQIKLAVKDSFQRLLRPSIESESMKNAKLKADLEAIGFFSTNLKQLLMGAPLGPKRVLAIDPGFRSGCKVVCLDEQGKLLSHCAIFPHEPQRKTDAAKKEIQALVKRYDIQAIAIGNGTAGRETDAFIRSTFKSNSAFEIYMVNESGASIYSASEIGREEFPNLDLTVRGSISIGRRLMDPLAELVKIDPKSIGVGQYQHDVAQDKLKRSLTNTVLFTVNQVGVNVNIAGAHLLQYVSGVGPKLAQSIVGHRNKYGAFANREALRKVKGMGDKIFEQCAGFLRVEGKNPLDATAVHPENYDLVHRMASTLGRNIDDLIGDESLVQLDKAKFITETVGEATFKDIVGELLKPGRDPRGEAEAIEFDEHIRTIEDVSRNMILAGKVTNLTKFGAFVDIGVKQDALLHISQIADRRISDPSEVLSLGQLLKVRVLDVDLERGRIGLSLKNLV